MRTGLLLSILLASLAPAQSVLIRIQQDNNIGQIANGGSIVVTPLALNNRKRYLPTSSQQSQAQLDLPFQEISVQTTPTVDNPSPIPVPPRPGLIVLGLQG